VKSKFCYIIIGIIIFTTLGLTVPATTRATENTLANETKSLGLAGIEITDDYYVRLLLSGNMPVNVGARISDIDSLPEIIRVKDTDITVRTIFMVDSTISTNIYYTRSNIETILSHLITNKASYELFAITYYGGRRELRYVTLDDNRPGAINNRNDLCASIERITWRPSNDHTHLVRAIQIALSHIRNDESFIFNQIVVFSDGMDTTCLRTSEYRVLWDNVSNSNIPIYTIGFSYPSTNVNSSTSDRRATFLEQLFNLSQRTGGLYYQFRTRSQPETVARLIAAFEPSVSYLRVQIPNALMDGKTHELVLFNSDTNELLFTHTIVTPVCNHHYRCPNCESCLNCETELSPHENGYCEYCCIYSCCDNPIMCLNCDKCLSCETEPCPSCGNCMECVKKVCPQGCYDCDLCCDGCCHCCNECTGCLNCEYCCDECLRRCWRCRRCWWWLIIPLAFIIIAGIVIIIKKQRPMPFIIDEDISDEVQAAPDLSLDYELTRPLFDGVRHGQTSHSGGKTLFMIINDISQPHKRYEIKVEATVEIGRSPKKPGIAINNDKKISRRHCSVTQRRGVLWLEDLGSANKTYVNDEALDAPRMLKDNDILTLGNTRFFVRIEER